MMVDEKCVPLLELEACVDMDLLHKVCSVDKKDINTYIEDIFSEYSDVFDTKLIGLEEKSIKLTLKENAVPVQNAPRRIPFARELNHMKKQGVIS